MKVTPGISEWLRFMETEGYVYFVEDEALQQGWSPDEVEEVLVRNEELLDAYPLVTWIENQQR